MVNGKPLTMEVDTGAALSIIFESSRKAIFPDEKLRPLNIVLNTYTEEKNASNRLTQNLCPVQKSNQETCTGSDCG